jgi:hypothetical protein
MASPPTTAPMRGAVSSCSAARTRRNCWLALYLTGIATHATGSIIFCWPCRGRAAHHLAAKPERAAPGKNKVFALQHSKSPAPLQQVGAFPWYLISFSITYRQLYP